MGGAGTMTLQARDILRYRTFHARAMERLLVVFAWVDPKEWFYRVMQAICRTAAEDAGELYKPDEEADR
ncbi:hypothetical protein [Mesorhizobium sp. M0802]|uniref:hypothetical protein n=1 Tax=Mesorhizobium sp. M0802 TaxID=2957001 RepID=UPI00333B70C2